MTKTLQLIITYLLAAPTLWIMHPVLAAFPSPSSPLGTSALSPDIQAGEASPINLFEKIGFEWNPELLNDEDNRTFFISAKPQSREGGTSGRLAVIKKDGAVVLEVLADDDDLSSRSGEWPSGRRQQVELVTPPYLSENPGAGLSDAVDATNALFKALLALCSAQGDSTARVLYNVLYKSGNKRSDEYCHVPMESLVQQGLEGGFSFSLTDNGKKYARRRGGLGFTLESMLGGGGIFLPGYHKVYTQATVGVRMLALINTMAINLIFPRTSKSNAILQIGAGIEGWMRLPNMTPTAAGFLNLLCLASYMTAGTDPSWYISARWRHAWGAWLKTPIYAIYKGALVGRDKELVDSALISRTFFGACQYYVQEASKVTLHPPKPYLNASVESQKLANVLQGMTPATVARFAQRGSMDKHGATLAMEPDPTVALLEIRGSGTALTRAGRLFINRGVASVPGAVRLAELLQEANATPILRSVSAQCPAFGNHTVEVSKGSEIKAILWDWCAWTLGPKRVH